MYVIGCYYDRGNVIIETESGSLKARNLRGHQLISREEGSITAYYLFNGHGDVVQLIDDAGEIAANYEYDIYGLERQAEEDIISNPYRYSGEYYDEETGLYYLRARYYDPELGRFISEDTYKGDMQDPLTLNYYIYCKGNPIKYIDPSGNMTDTVIAGGGSIVLEKIISSVAGALTGTAAAASGIVGVAIVFATPSKAGETEEDLKNDVEFQKSLSGSFGDPNKNNNKKDKKDKKDKGSGVYTNKTTDKFWKSYNKLPEHLQRAADKKFELFNQNPNHPGLNFEKLKGFTNRYSVRINNQYRAIGELKDGVMTWTEIIPHTYNLLE